MARTLAELTVKEFQELVERTVDRRFEVWLTQLMDALERLGDENGEGLRPEFAASLRRAVDQAGSGQGTTLKAFRRELA